MRNASPERSSSIPPRFRDFMTWRRRSPCRRSLPTPVNVWSVQNTYYELFHSVFPKQSAAAQQGDEDAAKWIQDFLSLGRNSRFAFLNAADDQNQIAVKGASAQRAGDE